MLACDREHCAPPTSTPTTTTSALNGTNSKNWLKPQFQKFCLGCHLYAPLTTSMLLMVSTVLCVLRVSVVLCQSAWGTMETRFVYVQLLKWALNQGCFYQHCDYRFFFFFFFWGGGGGGGGGGRGERLTPFKQISFTSKSCFEWCSSSAFKKPVDVTKSRTNNFLLAWHMWVCEFSVYPFPLWWFRENTYSALLSSSNRKYELLPIA